MAGKSSAGLLIYRRRPGALEVFLVHPGGPFWKNKDLGAWSIPKGELAPGEDPLRAARRELTEETGLEISGTFRPLAPVRQSSGKWIQAWAVEGDCDPASITSNAFSVEWPPRSGVLREFPEIDRAAWFGLDEARERIIAGQRGLLDQLAQWLGSDARETTSGVPRADEARAPGMTDRGEAGPARGGRTRRGRGPTG
jgi:predicted NUDIX family NTP pyrophosphohydrolase